MAVGSGVQLVGDWAKARSLLRRGPGRIKKAVRKALLQEGQFYRTQIIKGIRSQAPGGKAFAPLEPATIAAKGSSKALIDTGTLIRSVTVRKLSGGDAVFIGVARTVLSAGGQSLADIAAIHEFGAPAANIPPRPFLQPIEDKFGRSSAQRMLARIARNLLGDWGRLAFGGFGLRPRSPRRDPATGRFLPTD